MTKSVDWGILYVMLAHLVHLCFGCYTVLLMVRIFSSWIPQLSQARWIQFVHYYTDPYLGIFRKWIPPLGMLDLSPLVAFLALRFMERMILCYLIRG